MGSERRLCLWTAASSLLRLGTFSCVSYRTACALVPLSSLSLLFSSRLSLSLSPPRAPLSSVPFFSLSLSLSLFIIVLSRSSSSSSFSFRVISSSETKREKMCVKNERRGVFSLVSVFHKKQKTTHHEEHENEKEKRKEKKRLEKRREEVFFSSSFFLSFKEEQKTRNFHS